MQQELQDNERSRSQWIEIGSIVGPHGVRGEMKVHTFTRHPTDALEYDCWWLLNEQPQPFDVQSGRLRKDHQVVVRLRGVTNREQVDALRGVVVVVKRSQLPPLPEGEFYWRDVMGLKVVDQESKVLGKVVQIHETGANDVLQLDGDRERLIPWVEPYVKKIDLDAGVIEVDWIDID